MSSSRRDWQAWLTSTASKRILLFYLLLSFCVVLPYWVPVPVSIGISYVTQFSNRAFVILFTLATCFFTYLVHGDAGSAEPAHKARRLTPASLVCACTVVALLVWVRLYPMSTHVVGVEALYAIDRVRALLHGATPYSQFEFAYGPLHLFMPAFLVRTAHLSSTGAYYAWWALQWLVGTAMLWYCIQQIPFHIRGRNAIFWVALVNMIQDGFWAEGTAYAPTRMCGAAFLLFVVHRRLRGSGTYWFTALTGVFATILSFGISADQGIGVACGLLVWFALLAWYTPHVFSRAAFATYLVLTLALVALLIKVGYFITPFGFGAGAYSFPIVFSLPVFLVLTIYGLVPCALYPVLLQRDFQSVLIPMAFGGLAMYPAAFGRADLGHILLASPALLLGIGFLQSRKALRPYWLTATLLLFILPLCFGVVPIYGRQIKNHLLLAGKLALQHEKVHTPPSQAQGIAGSLPVTASTNNHLQVAAPCSQTYIAVMDLPLLPSAIADHQTCIQETYFRGLINVFNVRNMDTIVADLHAHPHTPLLLPDKPLDVIFQSVENNPDSLYGMVQALYIPTVRRQALGYGTISTFIQQNYTPAEHPTDGLRVWLPKP